MRAEHSASQPSTAMLSERDVKKQAGAFLLYASKLGAEQLHALFARWAGSKDFSRSEEQRIWQAITQAVHSA